MSTGSARGLRRRSAMLGAAAAVALPWAALGNSAQLPRFSSAPVGPGVPAGWRHETLPKAARSLSGREIPTAAICYVWGHAQPARSSGWNPYTDRVRMVVVDSGDARAMHWQPVARDLRRDWQEAFPGAMPPVRAVAVGADTDNTGDSVEAWFGDVLLAGA